MAELIKLELEVPVYLKKILELKYGVDFVVTESSMLGMLLLNHLNKKTDKNYSILQKHIIANRFAKSIYPIFISENLARRNGYVISDDKSKKIIKAIDRDIRNNLYEHAILNHRDYGIEYQTTFLNFLDLYDISEEELTYEALKKDFNRKRKNIVKKLKIHA